MLRATSPQLTALASRFGRLATAFPRASRRFLTSTQRIAKTEASRAATAVYAIGRGRVLQDLAVTNVNTTELSFVLVGFRRAISLLSYGARQVAKGITVKVLRDGARKLIPGAFLATGRSGNRLPFRRVGGPRLPIQALFGPSAADMLNNPKVIVPLGRRFLERASTELARVLRRALG